MANLLSFIFSGTEPTEYADEEASYGGMDDTPARDIHVPMPVAQVSLLHMADQSLSDASKANILWDIDSICSEQGVITMKIDDMDREIWTRHVTLADNKHPRLKRAEEVFTLEFMRSSEHGSEIISKTLRDLMPLAEDRQVWIQDIEISELKSDYPHSIEIKTEEPASDWVVWWPYDSPKAEDNSLIPFSTRVHNMINRIVNCNPEKVRIPRNRTWALYVAGTDLDSLATKIDDQTVLLKRNLSTVLMMETLRTSSIPQDMRHLLDACAVQNDSKNFKMTSRFYEYLKSVTSDTLRTTKLLDTRFEFRRFDQQPWVEQKDTIVNMTFQIQVSIFYRFFSPSEDSEDDS